MTSERRLAANRANAKRSTGPRTVQGRYTSSRNALRHGLASAAPSQLLTDIDDLTRALIEQGAGEGQIDCARQAARFHIELSRVRAARMALLASFDSQVCDLDGMRGVMALDRYERVARSRLRRAATGL